jgi:ribosome-associated toxin RatA of RatAB toxin-antitoxin module
MVKIVKEADLPFSASELFNAVADYEQFPKVFPSIKKATIIATQPGSADVEMVFNVPPAVAAFLPHDSQTVRATTVQDREIDLKSIGGAMKEMHIRWTFNEVSPGKTHVKFEMDYETGMNAAVSATVKIFISRNTKDVLDNLSKYAGKKAPRP